MSDFKERFLQEKEQLDERIGKLKAFTEGDQFPLIDPKQQELLNKQLPVMEQYAGILAERIELLDTPGAVKQAEAE